MATYTREQFVRKVLTELTVLDAVEAPEAEDYVFINEQTQSAFESLYEEGLIPFDLEGDIPARYCTPLVRIVAAESYVPYGLEAIAADLRANAQAGVAQLWKLRDKAYFGSPTQAQYF
jgi:hypothetical protein